MWLQMRINTIIISSLRNELNGKDIIFYSRGLICFWNIYCSYLPYHISIRNYLYSCVIYFLNIYCSYLSCHIFIYYYLYLCIPIKIEYLKIKQIKYSKMIKNSFANIISFVKYIIYECIWQKLKDNGVIRLTRRAFISRDFLTSSQLTTSISCAENKKINDVITLTRRAFISRDFLTLSQLTTSIPCPGNKCL